MKVKSAISNPKSQIVIVGAGPAGTSLAIRLAQKNYKITLIEREKFPRHKLCGEFISPECLEHFRELDVLDEMLIRGGDDISQTIFYAENGKNVAIPSEWFGGNSTNALGLSRAEMDFRLLEKAKTLGVEVLEECSVVGLLFEDGKICGVKVKDSEREVTEILADLTIDATGRSCVLAKLADREKGSWGEREKGRKGVGEKRSGGFWKRTQRTTDEGQRTGKIPNPTSQIPNRLVGFKTHLKHANIPRGVCEIYFFRGGYGGLSFVEDNIANHCFLIKSEIVKEFNGDADRILQEVIFQNERARETLKDAEKVFEWLAVSVDGFGIKNLNPAENLFAVGDASVFIDPFTGSGMLMALESAEILADVISHNADALEQIAVEYERRHRAKFRKRLRVCSIMRRLSFAPNFARLAIAGLSLSKKSRELLARSTRNAEVKKTSKA